MGPIRLIAAPIRAIARSRLVQLVAVLAIVLLLDHYSFDYTLLHQISAGLKALVDATVQFCAGLFRVGILTDPVLAGRSDHRLCLFGMSVHRFHSARRDARLRRSGRAA